MLVDSHRCVTPVPCALGQVSAGAHLPFTASSNSRKQQGRVITLSLGTQHGTDTTARSRGPAQKNYKTRGISRIIQHGQILERVDPQHRLARGINKQETPKQDIFGQHTNQQGFRKQDDF
jgi:hypothetical protein